MMNTCHNSDIWVIISDSSKGAQEIALHEMKKTYIIKCLVSKKIKY